MDPLTIVGLGLSVLPKIPDLWGKVAGLFGKEVPKSVTAAGQLAAEVQDLFTAGKVSPEIQQAMTAEFNRHEEEILRIRLEEKRIDAAGEQSAQANLSERHKSDMLSDSWLSKNVRPLCLLFFTLMIAIATFLPPDYVGQWRYEALQETGIWIYGYYFVGRTVEKDPLARTVGSLKAGSK